MEQTITILMSSPLFAGLTKEEIEKILTCSATEPWQYPPGSIVLRAGDLLTTIPILLTGSLEITHGDGSSETIHPGQLAIPANALLPTRLTCTARTPDGCSLLCIDSSRILEPCSSVCSCHLRMTRNLVREVAADSVKNSERLRHLSKRSTREKLLSYLTAEAVRQCSDHIVIPLDRQQLADYLSVDRSAMSAELSRMKAEGLIDYERSHFTIYHK
ncbi:MAG: Crp/Fnr family transcriptional regulator [Clostridia bacterium]|nr:Crp/Fnr family transcriptional regulator [Clostridia bacterium]